MIPGRPAPPSCVMVPLDGSEKDDRALAAAAAVAKLAEVPLHLVHVDPESADSRTELAGAAARLPLRTARGVTTAHLRGDGIAGQLVRHAAECGAALVVMATRAPGAVDRALHESVADEVMRESACPVMLVPPGTDYMRDKDVEFGRVLVPLDGSGLAERTLDFLLTLPGARALELALLEVVVPQHDHGAARERLAAVAGRLRGAGVATVEFDVAESGDPAEAVCAAVRESLVDMIAMSSRGDSGVRRLVLGSVAQGVVRATDVPVLLLTPRSLTPAATA